MSKGLESYRVTDKNGTREVTKAEFEALGPMNPPPITESTRAVLDPPFTDDLAAKVQAFFDELRLAIRAPHCGDAHRAFVSGLLLQAETAGLYSPPRES